MTDTDTATTTTTTTAPIQPKPASSSSVETDETTIKRDKSNPWGPSSSDTAVTTTASPSTPFISNNNDKAAVVSLASIMQQQESERDSNKNNNKKVVQFEETEEEQMIRLAIEASLADSSTHQGCGGGGVTTTTKSGGVNEDMDMDMDEDMKLALALSLQEESQHQEPLPASSSSVAAASSTTNPNPNNNPHLSPSEQESINRALREAQDEEMAASLRLALQLQREEQYSDTTAHYKQQGHVRTVNRSDFLWHKGDNYHGGGGKTTGEEEEEEEEYKEERRLYGKDDVYIHENDYDYEEEDEEHNHELDEYRVNAQPKSKYSTSSNSTTFPNQNNESSSSWTKIDRNTIIGPNNEIRTKHDVHLKNRSNAARLLSSSYQSHDTDDNVTINDKAYNSFLQKTKKRSMIKGVATHGHGRAENMLDEKTRGGAMDGATRLEISKAVNSGLIDVCNGVVKEGKEAIVYHAQGGSYSGGASNYEEGGEKGGTRDVKKYDVAIKVFKRIAEFKTRGKYVDGDPRYHGQKFNKENKRDQLVLWAEKEYRNLLRANKAGVPVPTPLLQKENILFMRFLGEDGWPSPQLREIDIKHKSKKWTTLYLQIMVAVRRLYHCARLVHGDLSEYNVLICPSVLVENSLYHRSSSSSSSREEEEEKQQSDAHTNAATEDADSLQIVLIDFGQAVERGHPAARDLLRRDLSMIRAFFKRQGIRTLTDDEAEKFVMKEFEGVVSDENVDGDNCCDAKKTGEDETTVLPEVAEIQDSNNQNENEGGSCDVLVVESAATSSLKDDKGTFDTTSIAPSTTSDEKKEDSVEAESAPEIKAAQGIERVGDDDDEEEEENTKNRNDDNKKSTWRHSIQGWDDERDMELLQEMLRSKKSKKVC